MSKLFFPILIAFSATIAGAADVTSSRTATPGRTRQVGVGIAVGGPVGLSLYGDIDGDNFVQGAIGWGDEDDTVATADYAFAYPNVWPRAAPLTPYWGIGVVAARSSPGMRIPLGINFVIPRTPVQLGAEIAPTVLLSPASEGYVQGQLHARVLF